MKHYDYSECRIQCPDDQFDIWYCNSPIGLPEYAPCGNLNVSFSKFSKFFQIKNNRK